MNMGQRASDTRGITFEDVVVPAEVFIISGSNKLLHVHINYSIATLHSVKNRIRVMVFNFTFNNISVITLCYMYLLGQVYGV